MKEEPKEKATSLQREELAFWESQKRSGEWSDLKMARDLPDSTPEFILRAIGDFEEKAASFCFAGSGGRILDAGCGNGNLLMKALREEMKENKVTEFVGMDFSSNMLGRARCRAAGDLRASFLQGSVTRLPFSDRSFDRVVSSGVLTCLPSREASAEALQEFCRVLKPGGVLVVDFFNRISHYTLARRHLFREQINPPEYVSPSEFQGELERAGFQVQTYLGFDFKLCQGYLFTCRWRQVVDPLYLQERLSRFIESRVVPGWPRLNLLGYRIYVKCSKR